MIVRYTLDPNKPYKMTAAEKKRLDETPTDYSDISELGDEFFRNATVVPPKPGEDTPSSGSIANEPNVE
jgi:hypothetical protein